MMINQVYPLIQAEQRVTMACIMKNRNLIISSFGERIQIREASIWNQHGDLIVGTGFKCKKRVPLYFVLSKPPARTLNEPFIFNPKPSRVLTKIANENQATLMIETPTANAN
jgi:hypothetical protein